MLDKIEKALLDKGVEILPPHKIVNGERVLVDDDPDKIHQLFIDTENHLDELIISIFDALKDKRQIQFCELILPSKAVEKSEQLVHNNLMMRYLRARNIMTDEMSDRWDILIKVDQSARPPVTKTQQDEHLEKLKAGIS